MKVELTEEEWTRLLTFVASAPYREVAPLIKRVMDQLLKQKTDDSISK